MGTNISYILLCCIINRARLQISPDKESDETDLADLSHRVQASFWHATQSLPEHDDSSAAASLDAAVVHDDCEASSITSTVASGLSAHNEADTIVDLSRHSAQQVDDLLHSAQPADEDAAASPLPSGYPTLDDADSSMSDCGSASKQQHQEDAHAEQTEVASDAEPADPDSQVNLIRRLLRFYKRSCFGNMFCSQGLSACVIHLLYWPGVMPIGVWLQVCTTQDRKCSADCRSIP